MRNWRGKEIEHSPTYMDDITLGLVGVTANTVRTMPFLRGDLDGIGIVVTPATTVALSPKWRIPTVEKISLRASIDARIAEEGKVTTFGVRYAPQSLEPKVSADF